MDRNDDQVLSASLQVRFKDAVRQFHDECFWWWDLSRPITTHAVAREVIRQLRIHGGKRGWRAAAELVRCL
jgi:hypothetical protein